MRSVYRLFAVPLLFLALPLFSPVESSAEAVSEVGPEAGILPYVSELPLRLDTYLSTVSMGTVPWRRRWYPVAPGEEVLDGGEMRHLVQGWETLVELARLFDLGFNELRDANPKANVWLPEPGSVLRVSFRHVLPRSNARIVVNLPEMRLYHKRQDGFVDTYPIGIGREGLSTPLGMTSVTHKKASPTWHVPESILKAKPFLPKVVPPGPDNPLGTHAVYLSIPSYLIHGTQKPYGVGRRVSSGCIRLYPEDIVRFFEEVVPRDTVEIVSQPVKAGWLGEALWLEVHDVLSEKERSHLKPMATQVVSQALARRSWSAEEVVMDWHALEQTVQQMQGVPQVVGRVWRPPMLEYMGIGWAWETKFSSYINKVRAVRNAIGVAKPAAGSVGGANKPSPDGKRVVVPAQKKPEPSQPLLVPEHRDFVPPKQ